MLDHLPVRAPSVPSERAFSSAGLDDDKRHSKISAETFWGSAIRQGTLQGEAPWGAPGQKRAERSSKGNLGKHMNHLLYMLLQPEFTRYQRVRSSNPNRTRTGPRTPERELDVGSRSRSELPRIAVKFDVRVRQILPEPDLNRTTRTLVHAAKAFCLATKVVLDAGHPLPGPFRFCRVINAAVIRAL